MDITTLFIRSRVSAIYCASSFLYLLSGQCSYALNVSAGQGLCRFLRYVEV